MMKPNKDPRMMRTDNITMFDSTLYYTPHIRTYSNWEDEKKKQIKIKTLFNVHVKFFFGFNIK